MATYKSKPARINRSARDLYDRFSDMSRLQSSLAVSYTHLTLPTNSLV